MCVSDCGEGLYRKTEGENMTKVICKIVLFSLLSPFRNWYTVVAVEITDQGECHERYHFENYRFNKKIQ